MPKRRKLLGLSATAALMAAIGAMLGAAAQAMVSTSVTPAHHTNSPYPTPILRSSQECMNVALGSTDHHALIQQYHCDDTDASAWCVNHIGAGYYEMANKGSGEYVDVAGGWVGDSVPLQQHTCHGGHTQQFRFVPVDGTCVELLTRHSGQCVDGSSLDWIPLLQHTCDGGDDQQWELLNFP